MRVSFDLDDTLVCHEPGILREPKLPWYLRLYAGNEPLRLGARALMNQLRQRGWELWIYTTSQRDPARVRRWLRCHGIVVKRVVNHAAHLAELQRDRESPLPSKNPGAFAIDLHVDDSEGVRWEGELHGFDVLVVKPEDADWVDKVLHATGERERSRQSDEQPAGSIDCPPPIPRRLRLWQVLLIPILAAFGHWALTAVLGQQVREEVCVRCGSLAQVRAVRAFGVFPLTDARRPQSTAISRVLGKVYGTSCREHDWRVGPIYVDRLWREREWLGSGAGDWGWSHATRALEDPLERACRKSPETMRKFLALALNKAALDEKAYVAAGGDPSLLAGLDNLIWESLRTGTYDGPFGLYGMDDVPAFELATRAPTD